MRLLDDQTTYEKILAYLENPDGAHDLTEHEQILAKRYIDAYTFYRDTKSRTETVAKLMKVHEPLSRAQAYRDVAAALSLFGDASRMTLQAVRHLVTEGFLEAINMARRMGEPDTMIKGWKELGKAWNIQNPMEETMKDLQPHTYIMNLDPQSIQVLARMLGGGSIDFGQFLKNLPVQDADYTEIKTGPEGATDAEGNA